MPVNSKAGYLFFLLITLVLNSDAKNFNSQNIDEKISIKEEFLKKHKSDSSIVFLKSFFTWYKTKFEYLDHNIHFLEMNVKSNLPYRINFHETKKYLSILKSSGFFSDNYINYYRDYFKKIDLILQKTKQNDGPVEGLDYDPIVHSQEPDALLENLADIQLSIKKSTANNVTIKMKTQFNQDTYLLYYLKKNNEKYLIDKIDFLIGDIVQK